METYGGVGKMWSPPTNILILDLLALCLPGTVGMFYQMRSEDFIPCFFIPFCWSWVWELWKRLYIQKDIMIDRYIDLTCSGYIGFLLLYNKLLQTQWLKTTINIISHSFCSGQEFKSGLGRWFWLQDLSWDRGPNAAWGCGLFKLNWSWKSTSEMSPSRGCW